MLKFLALPVALAASLQVGIAQAQSNAACMLFEHDRFDGRRLGLAPGEEVSFRSGQFWNDRASSARVARGCVLVAYQDTEMRGRAVEIDQPMRSLKRIGWNDRISSAICDCQY